MPPDQISKQPIRAFWGVKKHAVDGCYAACPPGAHLEHLRAKADHTGLAFSEIQLLGNMEQRFHAACLAWAATSECT